MPQPSTYTPLSAGMGVIKMRSVWIVEIPDDQTTANLDSDIPIGSIAIDADGEALYFKKTAGWKAITVAT